MRSPSPRLLAPLGALALFAAPAAANPRPLPFSYGADTLAAGETELEQFIDYAPLRALGTSGKPVWYGASQLQTEIEHGLTDRLELGVYLTYAPDPGEGYVQTARLFGGNGLKQRLRWRLAEPGEWPVDVALYGEVAETEKEVELEGKVILDRRFGRFRAIANLWAERELYFEGQKEWVVNPTAGLVWQARPSLQVGAEWWMRGEYPDAAPASRGFALGPHHYLGPTVLASFGRFWWSTGVYARLDDRAHVMQPGEPWGAIWGRMILGLEL
jgi:hypothetical protein